MKKILVFILVLAVSVFANELVFSKGFVKAHTEVFGDSTIDPQTSSIISHLSMGEDISSLKGGVDVFLVALKSDNSKRDEHMYKVLNVTKFPKTKYTIQSVKKVDDHYEIDGVLDLHGVKKPVKLSGNIKLLSDKLSLDMKTSFKMSSFGIKPPTLFFLTVRDKVDMTVKTTFIKK
jgi:polyisoprenoid-binding protein YceI